MSRKVLTLVSMIFVLAMLLSACGGGSQPAAAPTQEGDHVECYEIVEEKRHFD